MSGAHYIDDAHENEQDDYGLKLYDISSSPNDFNIKTIFDFIESGVFLIPAFQRNYVWDLKRASKLIESIIIGLPIPQIFLFEEGENKFLVIDGQQRLLSIYYFIKGRFPRDEKKAEIRKIMLEKGGMISDELIYNDEYYRDFSLSLNKDSHLHKKKYKTLEQFKITFELRTIRNIIIKQTSPDDRNSSMYEIFNRLNIGGVNLKPQEIRASIYHSEFYNKLQELNLNQKWRHLVGDSNPDIHMKDIEIILRAFALSDIDIEYKGNMKKFLNEFSEKAKKFDSKKIKELEEQFLTFLKACESLPDDAFLNKNKQFYISIFDAVYVAFQHSQKSEIDVEKFIALKEDKVFREFVDKSTTNAASVKERIRIAEEFLR
jgi:uncharacterized protein with ParB-like and HNH nuclease domain